MPHPSNRTTLEDLDELFTYHAPTPDQIPRYEAINEAAKLFAKVIFTNAPECADRTSALRKLRDARMWANAAVALAPRE